MGSSAPQHQRTYQRRDGLLTSIVDGSVLMMSVELANYFNLNPVGSRIWMLLEEAVTLDALVECLTSEYDAPPETIRTEVHAFLERLGREGLLKPAP